MRKYNPTHRKQYSGIITNLVNDNDNFHSLSSSLMSDNRSKFSKAPTTTLDQERRASVKN